MSNSLALINRRFETDNPSIALQEFASHFQLICVLMLGPLGLVVVHLVILKQGIVVAHSVYVVYVLHRVWTLDSRPHLLSFRTIHGAEAVQGYKVKPQTD